LEVYQVLGGTITKKHHELTQRDCTVPLPKQNEAAIAFLQKNMNLLKPTCTVPPLRKNEATAAFIENKHELTQTDLHCAASKEK
jgi:predicted metal-dependent hydrolase